MPPQVAAVEDVLSKSAHNYATDNTMTNDLTCSYLVLDCDSASAPSASPHRFYGTVYRPKLEMLLRWRLLRRNWKLLCTINTSVTDCIFFTFFICTLHFYLYVAGRLFAVSCYCLLLLLLLLLTANCLRVTCICI